LAGVLISVATKSSKAKTKFRLAALEVLGTEMGRTYIGVSSETSQQSRSITLKPGVVNSACIPQREKN
jgi:hypothetical protein